MNAPAFHKLFAYFLFYIYVVSATATRNLGLRWPHKHTHIALYMSTSAFNLVGTLQKHFFESGLHSHVASTSSNEKRGAEEN